MRLKMAYQNTIREIKQKIQETEHILALWFDEPELVRAYRPYNEGWTIDEILEHVSLTSFFLLKIIRKHVERSLKRAAAGNPITGDESNLKRLEPVGIRGSTKWVRPDHMEPTGKVNIHDVKLQIQNQFAECLSFLEQMKDGSGSLATVNMSVGNLGKMDMYQWIYFLTLHAWRHHFQMKEVREEFYREQIELVEVSFEDLEKLQSISIETFRETYEKQNAPADFDKHIRKRFNKSALLNELKNNESQFYFAMYAGEAVGYLKLNWGESQTETNLKNALEIERIYVVRRFHGKGIGKILFDRSADIARERNLRYLWLGVWEKNPRAIRFYEKQGLKVFDTHIFMVGEDRQTDYLMKLEL